MGHSVEGESGLVRLALRANPATSGTQAITRNAGTRSTNDGPISRPEKEQPHSWCGLRDGLYG